MSSILICDYKLRKHAYYVSRPDVIHVPSPKGQKMSAGSRKMWCLPFHISCLVNVPPSLLRKLIQYLFRVRASQNYHHPLCTAIVLSLFLPEFKGATKTNSTRKSSNKKFYILFRHIKQRVQEKGDENLTSPTWHDVIKMIRMDWKITIICLCR